MLDRRSLHKTPGLYTRAWHLFRANHVAMVALVVLSLIVIFVLSAGLISTYVTGFTPEENHLADKLKPPMTDGYILGSDGNGRDILTRLAYGGRVSIMIAVLSAFAIFFLGRRDRTDLRLRGRDESTPSSCGSSTSSSRSPACRC